MVQTVTWLSGCRKSLRFDSSMRASMSNAVSCKSTALGFS